MAAVLSKINDTLYTWLLIYLLAGSGIYFSIRTRFVQMRRFRDALRCMMEKKEGDKGVSSFQALMIATASRVGTGNMAGVATAIIMGGPGAAFWMWLMAILGSSSAFVESTLAQIYKKKEGDSFKGGPAYYIERALHARWLGIIFAISLIATFAFGFNGLQSYNIVSAFGVYVDIPGVMAIVLANAFDFRSIFGGFVGSCMVMGIKRGLFSNEAGMGSAPNASASATVSHPAKQGLAQIISVYIDTLLICSTTVFLILLTGDWSDTGYSGIPLLQQCVARVIGPIGIHFVTVIVCLFAFTSIIGNYFYAEANILFITKNKTAMTVFRIAAAVMVFIGARNSLSVAWDLADITMGLEAVVNIIAILLLGRIAFAALDDYDRVLNINPNNVLAYFNRAAVFMELGRFREAMDDYSQAINLYPDFAKAYMNRAYAKSQLGQFTSSKQDYDIAQRKIREYQALTADSTGHAAFADTARKYDRLLALDAEFARKDFDNELLQYRDVDIRLKPLYKVQPADSIRGYSSIARKFDDALLDAFIASSPLAVKFASSAKEGIRNGTRVREDVDRAVRVNRSSDNLFAKALVEAENKQFNTALVCYDEAIKTVGRDPV